MDVKVFLNPGYIQQFRLLDWSINTYAEDNNSVCTLFSVNKLFSNKAFVVRRSSKAIFL